MGMFSGKKRTTVTGIHQRLLEDSNFTYSSKIAITQWIWENSGKLGVDLDGLDLSDYFIEASQKALPKRFNKIYRFASKPDKYYYGLPVSHLTTDPEDQLLQESTAYLNQKHDTQISIYSYELGARDFYTEAWIKLVNDYGYDSKTNELTTLSKEYKYKCYLQDAYLTLSENTLEEYQDIGFNSPTIPFNYGKYFDREQDISREQSSYAKGEKDTLTIIFGIEKFYLPEPDVNSIGNSGYVDYLTEVEVKELSIDLSYINPELKERDNILPDNDWVYITYTVNDVYYWFAYEYMSGGIESIDKALKSKESFGEYYPRLYIRLNQKDIEDYDNKSKEKKDVRKILKKLDLRLSDVTKQLHQSVGDAYHNVRGLYLFMGARVNDAKQDKVIAEYCFNYFKRLHEVVGDDKGAVQVIQDKASSQTLKYEQMVHSNHVGKVAEVGDYILQIDVSTHKTKRGLLRRKEYHKSYVHRFIHQIDETSYEQIHVYNLAQSTWISGYDFTKLGYDEELVIPIDRSIINHLTPKERELFFYKSFHIAMLHVLVTKSKWYQRGAFKVLLAVIAVSITIASSGAGTTFLSMIKTATTNAIKAITSSYIVDKVTREAVKHGLNPKLAGLISFAVSLASVTVSVGMDFSKVLTAPNIMRAVNKSFNIYNKMISADYTNTMKQFQDLNTLTNQRNQLVSDRQKLLTTKVFNPTQELLKSNFTPTVNLYETVEMFYDRHYGFNVVKASHGLIEHFVLNSLANKQLQQYNPEDVENILLIE